MISLDTSAIAAGVNAGRLDPVAVTAAFLERAAALNPQLNALVGFDPDAARREAATVRPRLDAAGRPLPLAGVPVIVKDNVWVEGRVITQGSRLFADHVAPEDAIAVLRLRAAGAVILGIGNCPEFACKGVTNSPLHGPTRHPLDPDLTAGGSSGGNAAALAADFAPIALGTDGGGSGRRPPAHCGIVGFKPSFGAIPYGPGFPEPFWGIAVLAPMGRTVADTAALFEAVAGPAAGDPDSVPIAPAAPVDPTRLRIAYSPRLGLDVPVDADVADAIEAAVERLRAAGWPVTRADPAWPAGLGEGDLMPLQAGGLALLQGEAFARDPDAFDPDIAAQLRRGLAFTAADMARALESGARIRRAAAAFLAGHDLLLTPTAPCVAWPWSRLGPAEIVGVAVPPRGHAVFTPFFNHALTPALSLPAGRGRAGLPVGLQMIAARGRDRLVLAAAAAAEPLLAPLNAYPRWRPSAA